MSSDDGKLITYATLGFGAGDYWFFKGFRFHRRYRLLVTAPQNSIRGIAMDLVQIHGKARPANGRLLSSPVTKTPCLCF